MELNSRNLKISGFSLITLVIGMILVTPVLACPAGTGCGNNSVPANPIQLKYHTKVKIVVSNCEIWAKN